MINTTETESGLHKDWRKVKKGKQCAHNRAVQQKQQHTTSAAAVAATVGPSFPPQTQETSVQRPQGPQPPC